jgi:hypothetical protein
VNRGGFSWNRLLGITRIKSNISRAIGVPLTRSGRQRKIGAMLTGGGCALPVLLVSALMLVLGAGAARL